VISGITDTLDAAPTMAEQAHPDDLPTPRSTLRSRYA
jgi:hypothetical protein